MNIRKSMESSNKQDGKKGWVRYGSGLIVERGLLEKGLLVLTPLNAGEDGPISFVTDESFTIKDRKLEFFVYSRNNQKYDSVYPKQAANILSRIPAFNPYNDWTICCAHDINRVNPEAIPGNAIILTPTLQNVKGKKEDQKIDEVKTIIKKHFVTAYFVKQGQFFKRNNSVLKNEIDIRLLAPAETEVIQEMLLELASVQSKNSENVPSKPLVKSASDKVLQVIRKILSNNRISPFDVFIHNEARREEFFVPLGDIGLYVCPSMPKQEDNANNIFVNNFVTAVCMFGSSLKAIDNENNGFILIKHDKKFLVDQEITNIEYNPEAANPYERMLFSEFERLVALIKNMSNPDKPRNLHCHLPYIDYMLFGVKLFIHGRVTLDALGLFFKCVMLKKAEYVDKITSTCQQHNIHVVMESPFENLFPSLSDMNLLSVKDEEAAIKVLDALGVSNDGVNPTLINETKRKENEQLLVQRILEKLQKNTYVPQHRGVWEDILEVNNVQQNNDFNLALEGILKQLKRPTNNKVQRQTWDSYLKRIEEHLQPKEGLGPEEQKKLLKKQKKSLDLQRILGELKFNAYKLEDREAGLAEYEIWSGLLAVLNKNKIVNLEQLFKEANAGMIAISARLNNSSKTNAPTLCSLLPLTEKRIPIEYNAFQQLAEKIEREKFDKTVKKLETKKSTTMEITTKLKITSSQSQTHSEFVPTYPPAFSMTYLDPLVTYGLKPRVKSMDLKTNHNIDEKFAMVDAEYDNQITKSDDCSNQGPPFYFGTCLEATDRIIKNGGLSYAYKRVGTFVRSVKGQFPKETQQESEQELQRILKY